MKNKLALIFVATTLAFSSTVLKVSAQSTPGLLIQNTATGLCLGILPDGAERGLVTGRPLPGNIFTNSCNLRGFRQWSVSGRSDSIVFEHKASGQCLDSNTSFPL